MAKRSKTVMLTLRIPDDLRAALRKAAKADRRSVNNLVVAMLWKTLSP
jgi:predicted HicB family RNase H-like nuclease